MASGVNSSPDPASKSSVGALATRGGELQSLSARGLVNALNIAGFSAPNPLNTTVQECPAIGCDQSVVTDTLRVKSFETTAQAERYAVPRSLFQVETLVVRFAPVLQESERTRYRAEIQKLVD